VQCSQHPPGRPEGWHTCGMALKPGQLAFEEALLRERLKFVRGLKGELQQEEGLVAQTVTAYSSLIDGEAGARGRAAAHPPPPPVGAGHKLAWPAAAIAAAATCPCAPHQTHYLRDCRGDRRYSIRGAPSCADGGGKWGKHPPALLLLLAGLCCCPLCHIPISCGALHSKPNTWCHSP
jgi:hypothetical protein